ncbi:hypothetical protein [Algoriphagus antarcticus]|uniref:hypothetical protein n=1 Tax=Algoriphagus antarcticus TaxID=238540 RepID=UPI00146BBF71|nr:hypothetical protein [Algoriphagus antarcticus]
MKKLLTISILALLSACAGKESDTSESGNILLNLSFSVDTVWLHRYGGRSRIHHYQF